MDKKATSADELLEAAGLRIEYQEVTVSQYGLPTMIVNVHVDLDIDNKQLPADEHRHMSTLVNYIGTTKVTVRLENGTFDLERGMYALEKISQWRHAIEAAARSALCRWALGIKKG